MSDTMSEGTTAEAPAAAPAEGATAEALTAARAAEPAAPAAPAAAAEEADLDLEAEIADDLYSDPAKAKALVESLRKEAAKNRVKAKEATEKAAKTFEGWTESDAEVLANVIQLAAQDKKVGAEKMREIAALLDGGDVEGAAAVAADASAAAAEAAKGLTPEDVASQVEAKLAERDKQSAIQAEAAKITAKTAELGYDPADADYFTLLHIAQFETGGDLDKAHAKIEARDQKVIDAYVAGVKERAAGQPIHAKSGDDSVIEMTGENKTFATARERVEARLLALRK